MLGFALLAVLAGLPFAAQARTVGDFTHSAHKDDFTDEDRSSIFSTDTVSRGALAWKCLGDGLNVIYLFNAYLGGDSDDRVLVRYRIDRLPPSEQARWGMFPGGEAAYMPMHEVRDFTAAALSGEEIVLEVVDPLDGEAIRGRMGLSGLGDALHMLPCWRGATS